MAFPDIRFTVTIGDTAIPTFKSFRLEQRIGDHHYFELVLDLETGSSRFSHDMGSSSAWLGEPLTVRIDGSTSFLGVVTNVHMHREDSEFGHLVVSGYSATYRLETAPATSHGQGRRSERSSAGSVTMRMLSHGSMQPTAARLTISASTASPSSVSSAALPHSTRNGSTMTAHPSSSGVPRHFPTRSALSSAPPSRRLTSASRRLPVPRRPTATTPRPTSR